MSEKVNLLSIKFSKGMVLGGAGFDTYITTEYSSKHKKDFWILKVTTLEMPSAYNQPVTVSFEYKGATYNDSKGIVIHVAGDKDDPEKCFIKIAVDIIEMN